MAPNIEEQDIASFIRIARLRQDLVRHKQDLKLVEQQIVIHRNPGRRGPYDLRLMLASMENQRRVTEKTREMREIEERLRVRGVMVPPE